MRIEVAPEGMKFVDFVLPEFGEATAVGKIWLGDYLLIKNGEARPITVEELPEHNGYAAENAESGNKVRYYPRGCDS